MKTLKELLRRYLKQGLVLLVITVALTLLGLLAIELGRVIINVVTASSGAATAKDYRILWLYCAIMLLAILINGALNYWINILFTRITQGALRDIRLRLFSHLLQLPQEFFNKNPVGSVMALIIDDVSGIGQFFSKVFLLPIMNIMTIIFYTGYIFFLNWKLAIAAVISIPVVAFVLPRLNRRLVKLSEKYSDSVSDMTGYFQETLSGINEIRSSQTYIFEEARLKERTNAFFNINLDLARTTASFSLLAKVVRRLGPLTVYLYGGMLCLRGQIPVGTLVAAIAVVNSLYEPVDSFVSFIQEWKQAKVQFNKIDEYFSLRPEPDILPGEGQKEVAGGDINFDHVQFGFNDKELLLKDIRFTANSGKHLAFVGTSGSGKSLTTYLISRVYRPLSGKVTFAGKQVDSLRLYDLRSQIGYVSQSPFLFDDTLKKNILYALLRKEGKDNNRLEEWVDFSVLSDIDSMERLDNEIIRVIKEVGLFEDIYELGLRSKIDNSSPYATFENKEKALAARRLFLKKMPGDLGQYVEHYRKDKFLEYCTIFENIAFCPQASIIERFGSLKEFCRKYLNERLRKSGLLEKLFSLGLHLAKEDRYLLETLYKKKAPLLGYLNLSREHIENKVKIGEKIAFLEDTLVQMDRLDPKLTLDILDLAFNYTSGNAKEELLDEKTRQEILQARAGFEEVVSGDLKEKIKLFDEKEYFDALSLRENIIFGNVDPLRVKANIVINELIKNVVKEAGIEDLVLRQGLEFRVGERGNKLSGGQKQKVVIARIILKNPSVLVLDEATASLDASSQARIIELVKERFKDRTVISIAHRLGTVKDYDRILVFDNGQIVEEGTFEELLGKGGLFARLLKESG